MKTNPDTRYQVLANFDGSCAPVNPGGVGGWGFVLHGDSPIAGYGSLPASPEMTNNVAEYTGALEAVTAYVWHGFTAPLVVRGDSKLVVQQMSGLWRVKHGHYVPIYQRLRDLIDAYEVDVRWVWVPREDNKEADLLSRAAADAV